MANPKGFLKNTEGSLQSGLAIVLRGGMQQNERLRLTHQIS